MHREELICPVFSSSSNALYVVPSRREGEREKVSVYTPEVSITSLLKPVSNLLFETVSLTKFGNVQLS